MKNILLICTLLFSLCLHSQDDDMKYRRSSLHLMMMEDAKLPEKEIIINTFNTYPFPEKYNNHKIDIIRIPNFLKDDEIAAKAEQKAQKKADKENNVKLTEEEKKEESLLKI